MSYGKRRLQPSAERQPCKMVLYPCLFLVIFSPWLTSTEASLILPRSISFQRRQAPNANSTATRFKREGMAIALAPSSSHSRRRFFPAFSFTRRLQESLKASESGNQSTIAVQEQEEQQQESVHLKLNSPAMRENKRAEVDDETVKETEDKSIEVERKSKRKIATLHTYKRQRGKNKTTMYGLNVNTRKMCAWINYTLTREGETNMPSDLSSFISSKEVDLENRTIREELRSLWKEGRLLSERTEVLAVYESDTQSIKNESRRGGFSDLLHLYAQRLEAIIQDELEEEMISKGQMRVFNDTFGNAQPIPGNVLDILHGGLLGWLQREYGEEETQKLLASNLLKRPQKEMYKVLQHFLDWFRTRFPYYYDRCDHCGASAKDDPPPVEEKMEEHEQGLLCETDSDNIEESDDGSSFLGYVYPSNRELLGKASRTEIYQCRSCGHFTRFPRYNSASCVIQHQRGRCGEYSMLLFRLLRAAGHEARWIVDWADHVWAEIRLNGKWIHLDPCEAAVDKPLLYQEWGKQQTYIVAFRAPQPFSHEERILVDAARSTMARKQLPLIEDVTSKYTSDHLHEIQKRREESCKDIDVAVGKVTTDLQVRLQQLAER